MRALLAVTAVLGCAATTPPAPDPPLPPFSERLAAHPTWRPGDSEPTSREIVRFTPPPPPDATVFPLELGVEIRNRCAEPAIFTVGPAGATPDDRAPLNHLAAGEAIVAGITTDEHLFLRTATGWTRAEPDGRWIVFTGDTTCDVATSVR